MLLFDRDGMENELTLNITVRHCLTVHEATILTAFAKMRRFAPWLLGLFLMAQVAGVAPLLVDHAVHAFESQPAVGAVHDHDAPGRHGDHRHGLADIQDECCTLHHMAGIVVAAPAAQAIGVVAVSIVLPPRLALTTTDPLRLDRPPKSLS